MPQIEYGQQPVAIVGQIATSEDVTIDTLTNELLAQISTVTIAGTAADGVYSFDVIGPDGEVTSMSFLRASAESNAAIATALVADANIDDEWANTAVVVDAGGGVIDLDFIHTGRVYTFVVTSVPSGATIVAANTQESGGTNIELGVVVSEGSADELAAIVGAGTVDDDFAGIVVRGIDALVNDFGEGGAAANFAPDASLSVLRRGEAFVTVEDAVTKGADVFVRTQNAAAGDPLGLMRSDVDGGNAIAMTGARFASTTTARGLAKVRINRP